ncbi:hypothetical protein DL770_001974 [Monosporascus sp. CRB-9-2]|nr:hypothetical protein DL770_001974 [Monosporascus sp. CRB-9-2]
MDADLPNPPTGDNSSPAPVTSSLGSENGHPNGIDDRARHRNVHGGLYHLRPPESRGAGGDDVLHDPRLS